MEQNMYIIIVTPDLPGSTLRQLFKRLFQHSATMKLKTEKVMCTTLVQYSEASCDTNVFHHPLTRRPWQNPSSDPRKSTVFADRDPVDFPELDWATLLRALRVNASQHEHEQAI